MLGIGINVMLIGELCVNPTKKHSESALFHGADCALMPTVLLQFFTY